MQTIWQQENEIDKRETLSNDIEAEVAVIGGGLAGILTAYRLMESGVDVVVLEAAQIGLGQTKGSTAKITMQHNLIYAKLIKEAGLEKAKQYAMANQQAVLEYEQLILEKQIPCDYESQTAFIYSTQSKDIIKEEEAAYKELGIPSIMTIDTTLPFPVKAALGIPNQGQFHPLKFLNVLSKTLKVYENTRALSVDGHRVITDHGTVTAKKIVFATHYPFINMPGYYFARMHQERTYVLALEDASVMNGMYRGVDEDGLTFRNHGRTLLFGGGKHRTGENSCGGQYENLRNQAMAYYPDSKETAHWSIQDCMTLDSIPYIGQYSNSTKDWYVATGFGKWGVSSSMVSARIISDMILGKENPYAKVFCPERFDVKASTKTLLDEGTHAVKGLTRRIFKLPKATTDELPIGHGGVVSYEGEKVGVYKKSEDEVYVVSVKCPHLGCQLEWNPDELTWDCPCHGSRFDYEGNLIDNPAQTNLTMYE